jgi:hypothetical protein
MKYLKDQLVNVKLSDERKAELGIQGNIKNPCKIQASYKNSVDGHYVIDSANKKYAIPEKDMESV